MKYRLVWVHTKCGGDVDTRRRVCLKCKKKWGFFEFLLDPIGLRQIRIPVQEGKKRTYAAWADSLPYVGQVASYLPAWPRWLRILVFLTTVAVVTLIIFWIYWSTQG